MKKYLGIAFLLLVAVPIITVAVLSWNRGLSARALPDFGDLPAFTLQSSSGPTLSKQDLLGKVWIANFIFTRCQGQCPLISRKMQTLQRELRGKERLRFVSITVDPAYDTPTVLASYAQRYEAEPHRWYFLTGEKNTVESLVRHGFRLASSSGGAGGTAEAITHSFKFVLVDGKGRLRGYYDGEDNAALERLRQDAKALVRILDDVRAPAMQTR